MFGGGGGLDPSKMQQMMKQMGIDIDELDAEEVIIRTSDEELVFSDADVQRMDAQGQETYNIVGEPERRDPGSTTVSDDGADDSNDGIPQDDIELVAERAGASEDAAREALEATDGDLAAAVTQLK
ncbi:nascent polypeptide-associated complex protein [Halovenus rubra]|uniref:Nascent polypeptide-associated complex protein n=2 Tax=Halovenus rubra TaxID=869890 RepID=A0ABD5X4H5_9EURY|nr:nascent polypeptide-associated complex protein [Halovenus rubra]